MTAIDERIAIRRRAIELGLAGLHDLLLYELCARHRRIRANLAWNVDFYDIPPAALHFIRHSTV